MADVGPLNPTRQVPIAYPDVPANCVGKLNDLISTINNTTTHLNTAGGQIQTFMGQANGAVQNVVGISQGKGAQALAETWYYSLSDGNQAQNGMCDVATHLDGTTWDLSNHLQTVTNNMSTLDMVRNNGGTVSEMKSDDVQAKINDLSNALNNIGMLLDAAAKLINTMNGNWPSACATGFTPGSSYYPTFTPHSFDNSIMHMSGNGGSALESQAGQKIINALGSQEEAEILIMFAEEEGVNLTDVAALVEKGMNPDQIVQWIGEGKNINGVSDLLNKAPIDQINQWVEQGANLKGINALLDKGISEQAINTGLSRTDPRGWTQVSNKVRNNMTDAIRRWANGQTRFPNDGTTFQNREGILPKDNGPFTEYTVDNRNTGYGNTLRIISDKYGNLYYVDDHYVTRNQSGMSNGKVIPVPWSFVLQALGQ